MAKIPESIGKYKVEQLIAQGGMGAVFKAMHPTLNRPVIIKKLILKGNKNIAERFKREAFILMDFRHDQIVDMYDHFREGNSYYIVLEYVEGITVEQLIKKSRYLHSGTAAYILQQTAQALDYAHKKNVIHRDIKPANILLSKKGEVKLVDFGIAATGDKEDDGLTQEGMTLGTPGYMAPEQFQDTKNVDRRADIYSLGVLGYEMLTGKKPFPGGFSPELMSRIQRGKYLPMRQFNPWIPRPLHTFVCRSMKVRSKKRFQNMMDGIKPLKRFLKSYKIEEISRIVADAASGKEIRKPSPRKRVVMRRKISLYSAAGLVLICGLLFCFWKGYFQEILAQGRRGAVTFTISQPTDGQKLTKINLETELKRQIEDKYIPYKGLPLWFWPSKEENTLSYITRKRYLPAGNYLIKTTVENEAAWNSFTIVPRKVQRASLATKNGLLILAGHRVSAPVPLDLSIQAKDGTTGKILEKAKIVLVTEGKEIPFERIEPQLSGTTFTVKVTCPGYLPAQYTLETEKYQKRVTLDAGLEPIPAEKTEETEE